MDLATDLAPGTLLLGRYRSAEVIGRGGVSTVYAGRDEEHGELALKVIDKRWLSLSPSQMARFEREAEIARSLRHAHLVRTFDSGIDQVGPVLVMARLTGDSLDTQLGGPDVAISEATEIGLQLISALGALHSQGVVHRDLKPGNVMVDRTVGLDVKIFDFGTACLDQALREARQRLTPDGRAMGTPGYASPEQTRGERGGPRSDLFSLGVILYELAAGRPPFDGPSYVERCQAVLHQAPTPLEAFRKDVPGSYSAVVARALSKRPEDRFASSAEMGEALRGSPAML